MRRLRKRTARHTRAGGIVVLASLFAACTGEPGEAGASVNTEDAMGANPLVELLASGQAVFGIFSGDHTPEQGVVMAQNLETDFVFYSLESGPFDIPAMEAYMQAMRGASEARSPHPVALRIPPIRTDGADSARARVRAGLEAGARAIVFPHVESPEDARVAVGSLGSDSWPANPSGGLINILLIEDQIGIGQAMEIAGTPGVSVVIPGPGDLRRAYEDDMEAVEDAIQTVLGACKAHDVACGITAGVEDIGERLAQGFRLIIVTQPEALTAGREAAGR